ncbi:hypothetical protein GCM10009678_76590 [Actinomadura kijaniata]
MGESVHFLLERHDLLARFFEGRHETLVLTRNGGQIGLCLMETFFQNPDLAGGFRELATQHGDLLL